MRKWALAVTGLAFAASCAAATQATKEYVDARTAEVPATVTNVVEGVVDEAYVSSLARQISRKKDGVYTRVAIGSDGVPYVEVPPKKASLLQPDGTPFATSGAVVRALAPYAKKTEIPTVPTKVSALTNDAGYLTSEQVLPSVSTPGAAALADSAVSATFAQVTSWGGIQGKPDVALKSDVSAATNGLASMVSDVALSASTAWHAADAVGNRLTSHEGNTSNPHKVTAAQAGAVPTSRKVNGKALSSDVTLGAADVGAYTKAQSDNAYYPKDEGDLWAAWWSGDGFRVTVTNYNVAPSADVPWSRLPSVRFDYRPDGIATNPLVTVWSEETKWTRWRGEFAVVTNDFRAALDLKAGLDWGRTSPTGFDAPEGFTWLDTPATVISGGLAWQKTLTSEGAFWVLSSNGMVAQFGADGASTNGYFRITDERGNAVFEIVAGDKVTVGADPASVHTWQHTDGRTRLRVVYEIDSDTAPTLYAAKSLVPGGKTDWRALGADGCAALAAGWTGARGAWTNAVWLAEAPASSADDSLFVCATYEQGGETVVKNHAAVSMEKLVFGGKTYTMGTATIDGHTVLTLTEVR